jgi:hypothetical protein
MEAAQHQRLLERYSQAVRDIEHLPPIRITLDPVPALMLLSNLQLALRHPQNVGPSASIVRAIAQHIQEHLSVNNDMRQILQMGWNRAFDHAGTGE